MCAPLSLPNMRRLQSNIEMAGVRIAAQLLTTYGNLFLLPFMTTPYTTHPGVTKAISSFNQNYYPLNHQTRNPSRQYRGTMPGEQRRAAQGHGCGQRCGQAVLRWTSGKVCWHCARRMKGRPSTRLRPGTGSPTFMGTQDAVPPVFVLTPGIPEALASMMQNAVCLLSAPKL